MEIESVGGMVSLKMNGYTIDTFDNSAGTFSNGTLMLGQSDPFNSVNIDNPNANDTSNLAVFDNIVLTAIPEPSSLSLIGLALAFFIRRRR